MTAQFALEPPLTSGVRGGDGVQALTHGPLFVRSHGMGRWHRPRWGVHHLELPPAPNAAEMGWPTTPRPAFTHYHLWCGQSASTGRSPRQGAAPGLLTINRLPTDGAPVCGTCEGRAVGAGHPAAAIAGQTRALLFEPRRLELRVCPGYLFAEYRVTRYRLRCTCLICGVTDLRLTGGSRGYGWTPVRAAPHEPGPGLVPGCPFHAWRQLVLDDSGRVGCSCGGGGW